MSIRLHSKHGVAPALTFCRICGKDANEIALLGSQCDTVLEQVYEATNGAHGNKNGYQEYGQNRIPATEPCDECQKHLKAGGTIIIAKDTGEYLRLDAEQIDHLQGRVADAKGRFLDFKACAGKILNMNKAFWFADSQNIRLRDPKEWTE
jgi:hypothetical protein